MSHLYKNRKKKSLINCAVGRKHGGITVEELGGT
jgi:hypothetical protein